ncbi:hypothetical protein AB0D10_00690 [Kitasatospora sp. NPDC048545]|uniref:hypothetical protein n=1 Tax=Kitasatospora sp. NPDC048545 TaxID=3157208 RepID=UPI0033FA4D73
MPRPDWRHMPATDWYGLDKARQDALFDPPGTEPPGTDPDTDDFGTAPFEGCTVDELSSETQKCMWIDK